MPAASGSAVLLRHQPVSIRHSRHRVGSVTCQAVNEHQAQRDKLAGGTGYLHMCILCKTPTIRVRVTITARCCGRFLKFLGILTLESFCSSALGLAVGAVAPSTDAAVAIGPAVMLVWIIFGGG